METLKKSASVSRTEQTYLLIPQYMNAAGRLYGGQLLYWIDMTAGIVALRHADSNVVTACVDNITFKDGAFLTDVVTLIGQVTYTGRTSMEVRIDAYRENKGGERFLINRAYLVLVSLDDDGKPKEVPQLLIETEEQQAEWEAALERK
ncbi:MAG: acyl-CoA thioesterase, partial [Dorea sp.]|nr:acyl-CoA thioesterase [Dorea sp.]